MQMLIDLTVPLTESLPPYPGDPPLQVRVLADFERGDDYRLSAIALSAHLGTHLDAPLHFVSTGASVDDIAADLLWGTAAMVECLTPGEISRTMLAAVLPPATERLLIKTTNASDLFPRPTAWLSGNAARLLAAGGLKLVGIDSPSVDRLGGDNAAHRILLGNGICIVENLDLRLVRTGTGELVCLPLRLVGLEGSPVRAILKV